MAQTKAEMINRRAKQNEVLRTKAAALNARRAKIEATMAGREQSLGGAA